MNQHTHGGFEDNFQNYRPKPDGRKDPAGEAGWFLQRERERRKISLRDVAQSIRVHPIHLDAIERGDLTRMPHRSEAIGMAGAYAEYLGFDPQPMMMQYAQLLPRNSAPKQAGNKTPQPLGSARIIEFPMARRLKEMASGPGGVVASVAVAMMLFGGVAWSLLPGGETAGPQLAGSSQQVKQETVAESGADARRKLEGFAFDLLIVDVMMPGETGFSLTRSIRATSTVPILMLTARSETENRIEGLESGADDYLAKPFEPRELLLRIAAILRRQAAQPARAKPANEVRFGPFVFEIDKQILKKGEEPIRLTDRERQLMKMFAEKPGDTIPRHLIVGEDTTLGERTADVQINRLRRKIEADPANPLYLQTVRGIGYRLVTD